MHLTPAPSRKRKRRNGSCTDQVVGAILSGWRYDISGISPAMRGDYEEHLAECTYCQRKQRVHRTVDVLLLCATTLSFAAFLLVALVIHRIQRIELAKHLPPMSDIRVPLHQGLMATSHIPSSITISLQAVAIAGVVVSMLLWVLVAIATPVPGLVSNFVLERVSPEVRERLHKRAA